MRTLKFVALAGLVCTVAAPAFATKAGTAPSHPRVTEQTHRKGGIKGGAHKKEKKEGQKCDAQGHPCTKGEDCTLSNCHKPDEAPPPQP